MVMTLLKMLIAMFIFWLWSCHTTIMKAIIMVVMMVIITMVLLNIINNYWTRLGKISWFVRGEQINNWSARHWQITIFCDNRVQELFYHLITEFVFFNEYPRETKRSAIFTQRRSQEGEKYGFLYACAQYNLQPNTVGRHCAWADHYL